MYDRPLDTLLVTFGVGLILQQVARDLFGAPAVNVIAPEWLSGGVEILGAVVPKTRIFILVLAVGVRGRAGHRAEGQPDGPPHPRRRAEPRSR